MGTKKVQNSIALKKHLPSRNPKHAPSDLLHSLVPASIVLDPFGPLMLSTVDLHHQPGLKEAEIREILKDGELQVHAPEFGPSRLLARDVALDPDELGKHSLCRGRLLG